MDKRRRITFDAWGSNDLEYPQWAYTDPWEIDSPAGRVAGAIARKNRLDVVTVRSDGTRLSGDTAIAQQYQVTLGRRLRSGGWTDIVQCWISIPINQE